MAANFIVEDGTGVSGANSYVTTDYADQYFLDRNNATWTGDVTVKQPALVQATDYVTTRFNLDPCKVPALGGPAATPTPLTVPDKLMRAICEYAVRALTGPLIADPTVDATGRAVVSTTETVGPITETISYQAGGSVSLFKPYPAADLLLKGLIVRGQGGVIRG